MSEHTKEPWMAWKDGSDRILFGPSTNYTAGQCFPQEVDSCEANARRIVACVNACAGISTEDLEIITYGGETMNIYFDRINQQRDELVAADSMGDQNGLIMPTTKLNRGVLSDGTAFILGCAGETSWARMLHKWVKTLTRETLDTAMYPHQMNDGPDRNDPHGIIVLGRHGAYYKTGPVFTRLEREYHAVGSGRDFAIAAMALGHDAIEAVKLAIELDCYSGGEVLTMGILR